VEKNNVDNNKEDNHHDINVFHSDDEKLKLLGELLSNKSSRNIIKLLLEKEMYTNEIANNLDMRISLVIHHLKKLEELGLLQITNKSIVKKGNKHKHFKINPYIFLLLNEGKDKLQNTGLLKRIFKKGVRHSVLGGFFTFALIYYKFFSVRQPDGTQSEIASLTFPLLIIILGFIIHHIAHWIIKQSRHRL